MDCGPTSLAIVAQHYKVQVSGDYLLALEAGASLMPWDIGL